MTCVVAVKHDGAIYMGADSAASDASGIRTRNDQKIFEHGEFMIGFCGSYRIGQLIRYSFQPPDQGKTQDDMDYMVNYFVETMRDLLKQKGALLKIDEEELHGSELLVGYNNEIYVIGADFQVGKPAEDFAAIGSGEQTASGALFALRQADLPPEQKCYIALEAAAEYCLGVRGPFNVIKQSTNEES